jgi:hypothetical protein
MSLAGVMYTVFGGMCYLAFGEATSDEILGMANHVGCDSLAQSPLLATCASDDVPMPPTVNVEAFAAARGGAWHGLVDVVRAWYVGHAHIIR